MPGSLVSSLELGFCSAGIACLLVAALHDLIARTAPNWTAAGILVCGLVLRLLHGNLLPGLGFGLGMLLITGFCWRRGWIGGGDVKLLTGAAVFVPPTEVMSYMLAVTLSGGVLALLYLAARHFVAKPSPVRPRGLLRRVLRIERWRIRRGGPLPYACAIAAGGLLVLL